MGCNNAGTAEEPKDKLMGFCGGSAPSSPIALLVLALLGLTDTLGGTKIQLYEAGRIKDKGLGLLNVFKGRANLRPQRFLNLLLRAAERSAWYLYKDLLVTTKVKREKN